VTLSDGLSFVRRWWWLLVAGTLFAAASTYVVSGSLPRVYEARATLLVGATAGQELSTSLNAEQLTTTYAELVTTQPVLAEVAASTGIAVEDLQRTLVATPVRDTQFIQLSLRSIDPKQAAAVVNTAANTAVRQLTEDRAARVGARVDRLTQLVASLAQSDRAQTPEYGAALAALQDARVAQASAADVLTITEPATEPSVPVLPRVSVDVFSAAVVGLVLALLVGIAVDLLADRPLSPIEMAKAARVGVVESVPRIDDPLADEAFRLLRSALCATFEQRPYGIVLVTSAAPGEGKTTVVASLGAAFARAGDRVILVDANLRRPRLADVFPVDAAHGLTVLLSDPSAPLQRELQPTVLPELRLLAAGPPMPMATDLVASRTMRQRLEELRAHADLVIVDSPSLEVSDPLALLGGLDGVLLVVDPRRSGARAAARAATEVRDAGGRVLALVVNEVPVGASRRARRPARELATAAQRS
jgi:polysaccharide biosynthesis transport protein